MYRGLTNEPTLIFFRPVSESGYYDGHGAEFWALPDVVSDEAAAMLAAGELRAILVTQ